MAIALFDSNILIDALNGISQAQTEISELRNATVFNVAPPPTPRATHRYSIL